VHTTSVNWRLLSCSIKCLRLSIVRQWQHSTCSISILPLNCARLLRSDRHTISLWCLNELFVVSLKWQFSIYCSILMYTVVTIIIYLVPSTICLIIWKKMLNNHILTTWLLLWTTSIINVWTSDELSETIYPSVNTFVWPPVLSIVAPPVIRNALLF